MKQFKLILLFFCLSLTVGLTAQNTFNQARIYINPGHGGWWSEDRNLATINHALRDTTGFYETNTNLIKGLSLWDELTKAGAGFIKISRTRNGIVNTTTPSGYYPQDTDIPEGTDVDGVKQIVTLSVICTDVETNNMDYFISIHSNAATEGTSTNYPLVLYRGTDAAVGNGLTNAKNMGVDAWKWINDNGVTYKSAYTAANTNNVRGDITFMGGSSTTTPIPDGYSYTGYYGVLRHGCDGYLVEGCFHTYQPERQRLLNKDYCRQEGLRYARAIRAWFGDNTETKGGILGTVKDKYQTLEHNLYHYKENSIDAYKPLNEVTVVLQDAGKTKIAEYKTDKEYNGVYSFPNLTPGIYYLVYDIAGYWKETVEIEVTANKTSFINKNLTDLSKDDPNIIVTPVDPEVIDYPHPNQDGNIAVADLYNFKKDYELTGLEALQNLTIRRAILRDGKYYVLAVDAAKNPKLLVLNPVTGQLIKEMSTAGVVTTGYNGKAYPYILSDIAFTADGVLLGANSTVVGKAGNAYQTGDFYLYKWQATTETALEDATPAVLLRQATNDDNTFLPTGFNNSNFMANSIAVNGNLDNFKFYFDSHAGNDWTTSYNVRLVCWIMKNGVMTDWQYNNSGYTSLQMGEDVRMTLSPLKIDQIIMDGNKIAPREFKVNWDGNEATLVSQFTATEVPVESMGATYFRYVDKIYMSAPVCEKTGSTWSYKSLLYDITAGLDKAKNVGTTDAVITNQPAVIYMTSTGVVDNADIDQYLLVGTNIVKYTTKGVQQPASPARIFAYNLNSVKTTSGYDISYILNEAAKSVELILTDATTGTQTKVIPLTGLAKGANQASILESDLPGGNSNWSLRATAGNVSQFTKISDDSEAYRYFAPKSVSIDKSPESNYFGRVYVSNTGDGSASGRATTTGVYVLNPDGSDVTGQGNTAYNGGLAWTKTGGSGPRKLAVASDGRLFLSDMSAANAGIYVMNPETYAMASLFPGAVNANAAGSLKIGSTYVAGQTTAIGIRGTGANTQLYAVDMTLSGVSYKKYIHVYNIGESSTWTTAPSSSFEPVGTYIGNENNSIVPVSTGHWAGQYRGAGSNSSGNPCMFYYDDTRKGVMFNTAEPDIISTASNYGALAVNEAEKTVVLSVNGGVSVFTYVMSSEGIPAVTEKFWSNMDTSGALYDDFEFDYAGNLYAVSNNKQLVSVWSMPTNNNSSVIPAKKALILQKKGSGIEEIPAETVKIYPNPAKDVLTIEQSSVINTVDIYSLVGKLVNRKANIRTNAVTLDISHLEAGIYLVKVNNGKAFKIVKN